TAGSLLLEAAAALQDFDLVAVGILDEEELPERLAFVRHLLEVLRRQAGGQHARMLARKIFDDEGHVPVAVTKRIRLGATLVDGKFDLEWRILATHVDQREVGK